METAVIRSAFYVPERLAELNNVFWITRVPAQLKEAKALLNKPKSELVWEEFDSNYRGSIYETTVYALPQRWVVIESQHATHRELKTFQRQLDRTAQALIKTLWHLGNQTFQCKSDALVTSIGWIFTNSRSPSKGIISASICLLICNGFLWCFST
jgi:transposase